MNEHDPALLVENTPTEPNVLQLDTVQAPEPRLFSRRGLLWAAAAAGLGSVMAKCSADEDPVSYPSTDIENDRLPSIEPAQPTPTPEAPIAELVPSLPETDVLVAPEKVKYYIGQYTWLAVETAQKSQSEGRPVPYEVFLAVAMHETDSGTSELAQNAYNHFGVIAKDGWTGDVYSKTTKEQIPADQLNDYMVTNPDLHVVTDNGNGTLRVSFQRPFRKYPTIRASYEDFVEKLYHQNADGSFRYGDVVDYLNQGGADAHKVVEFMSDESTEQAQGRWATGDEWFAKVSRYISLVHHIKGQPDGTPQSSEIVTLPEPRTSIELDKIDFSTITREGDAPIIEAMKLGFEAASLERFTAYVAGIINKNDLAQEAYDGHNGSYRAFYPGPIAPENFKYILYHLWAVGVKVGETHGISNTVSMERLVRSFAVNQQASIQYMSDKQGETWQLTETPIEQAMHAASGVMDEGAQTHPDLDNKNSVGLEVQADSIYDVTSSQFENMVYWATHMLLSSQKVQKGMLREEVDRIVDQMVIGHGKNEGREFGYSHTRPIIDAVQQFVYVAVNN